MFKTQVELLYEAMEFHWNSSTRDSETQNEQLSGGEEGVAFFQGAWTLDLTSLCMLQVKIKFRLTFFNLGWFSISFVP